MIIFNSYVSLPEGTHEAANIFTRNTVLGTGKVPMFYLISGPGMMWDLWGDRDRMGVLGYIYLGIWWKYFWGYFGDIYPKKSENIWGYDGIMWHIYIMNYTGKAKHRGPIRNQLRYAGLENGGQPAEWGTFSFSDKLVYTRLSETHCPVLTQIGFISNFLY